MKQINYTASWIKTGSICGLLSLLTYFAAAHWQRNNNRRGIILPL